MKKLLVNVLCAFVPNRQMRKRIRARWNNPIVKQMVEFAKSFSSRAKPDVKYTFGFRCANFVVNIDDKWVFKFPLRGDAKEISEREKRITDALRPLSPIKIPNMEILEWNGICVRKYECVSGIGFHSMTRTEQNKHADVIARQLAKYLYIVGHADPKEIANLKPKKTDKPAPMHGWNQNDLWDNFIMNPDTFEIVAIIDWEGAEFNDFYSSFTCGTGNDAVKIFLLQEYMQILQKHTKK